MKAKAFIIAILALPIPLLFTINIIRTQVAEENETITTTEMLGKISNLDLSFSSTYLQIAESGKSWELFAENINSDNMFGDEEGDFTFKKFFETIKNFFQAIWQSICIPFVLIGEICTMLYECIMVFVSFVGFVPS